MTDKEILEKIIEKAEEKGFDFSDHIGGLLDGQIKTSLTSMKWLCKEKIIFSHEFAKVFWGESCYYQDENQLFDDRKNWQYHLQQMVLEKNPLLYLATFLTSPCCNAPIKYTENSGVYICPGIFCDKCKKLL
ncbi:MAG: hypothetical protein M0R03_19530 [Novosphingobium sp.]|nr:hypothetical protein [Novosphingobium sp.]